MKLLPPSVIAFHMNFKLYLFIVLLFAGVSLRAQDSIRLPVVVINTNGQEINDTSFIMANCGIIDYGPNRMNHQNLTPNVYDGWIGMKFRGNWSFWASPQKSYRIETRNPDESNNNVELLGMPKENDWSLTQGYSDPSLSRDELSYRLFRDMGRYATRKRHVVVFVNGEYNGIYSLSETIKQDKNRVDVAKLTEVDTVGDQLTGGYIFKHDESKDEDIPNPPLNFHDPDMEDLHPSQFNYMSTAAADADVTIKTHQYRGVIDVGSFIDYYLLSILCSNIDAYKRSRYFFKTQDSDGGLINAGPVWDFDWAWTDYEQREPLNWIDTLLHDPAYANEMKCRYEGLRNTLFTTEYFNAMLDSIAAEVDHDKDRHFDYYDVLGNLNDVTYRWTPFTYNQEINNIKDWISDRLDWLDNTLIGTCDCDVASTPSVVQVNDSTATISWDAGNADGALLEFGKEEFFMGTGTQVEQSGNAATLTDLKTDKIYRYYIQSSCSSGNADWSGPYFFSLESTVSVNEYPKAKYSSLFPNPAKDEVNISINGYYKNNAKVRLYDGIGRELKNQQIVGNRFALNICDISRGHYLVIVEIGGQKEYHQLVVR